MKIYTTLDTLSKAWEILDDLNLSGILLGKTAAFDAQDLLNALFREKKLQEFLAVITHEDPAACGDLTTKEAAELLTAFFASIGSDLSALPGLGIEVGAKPAPPLPKKKQSQ